MTIKELEDKIKELEFKILILENKQIPSSQYPIYPVYPYSSVYPYQGQTWY